MVLVCSCTNPGKVLNRKPSAQPTPSGTHHPSQSSHGLKPAHHRRRDLMSGLTAGLVAVTATVSIPTPPSYARGLSSYIKKKMLDPLDSYVTPLLTAKKELKSSGEVAETDVKEARSMLRSGALSGYRMNVRAVGEYAERLETASDPKKLVETAIRDLENFDSSLLLLSRGESSQEEAKKLLETALTSIDSLLESVPPEVMKDVTGGASFQEPAPES